MHYALSVDDVQCAIALDNALQRRDLYNLSLVSRSWRAITEPLLWREVPSLITLLKLMPEGAWEERSVLKFDCQLTVLSSGRALEPNDWHPVLRKSRYVRQLDVACQCDTKDWPAIQQAILQCPPPPDCLPSLEYLRLKTACCDFLGVDCWFAHKMDPEFIAILLFQPALRAVAVSFLHDELVPRLSSLLAVCRRPVALDLDASHTPSPSRLSEIVRVLGDAGTQLSGISLRMDLPQDVCPTLLVELSRLPALTALDVSIPNAAPEDEDVRVLPFNSPSFPALRKLTLRTAPTDIVLQIVRAMRRCPLAHFEFCAGHIRADEIAALCRVVHDHCDHAALTYFCLDSFLDDPVAETRVVRPLVAFKRLWYLRVLEDVLDVSELAVVAEDDIIWARPLEE
ncbi:hypothetical protein HDZ31DRAFT_39979 [Schizophyllum fasciatum]